jgi:hypothetical protein
MSRCQQVVPEGKDDKPQRPGELAPLHNVVALLVVLPLPPRVSPPPDEVGHGKISYCTYSDRCLAAQNAVTSVAITRGSEFRRNHICCAVGHDDI